MPTFQASPDLRMHYLVDDFTEPWTTTETTLLLHGNAESSLAWYAWVPLLARHPRIPRQAALGVAVQQQGRLRRRPGLGEVVDEIVHSQIGRSLERRHREPPVVSPSRAASKRNG